MHHKGRLTRAILHYLLTEQERASTSQIARALTVRRGVVFMCLHRNRELFCVVGSKPSGYRLPESVWSVRSEE